MLSRRQLIGASIGTALAAPMAFGAGRALAASQPPPPPGPMTAGVKPISTVERNGRIEQLQQRMLREGVGALLVESGSSLEYFTGVRWSRSERITAAIIPAKGAVVVVTPAFEAPSIRETLSVAGDVRPWNEHESAIALIVQALGDLGVRSGRVAVEQTIRFFIVDGVRSQAPGLELVSGERLVRACRLIKSSAEIRLMQIANDITLAALKSVHGAVQTGMTAGDIAGLMNNATAKLGGRPEFALVLLNEASAFPHGSVTPQSVREGGVILMDCGCTVEGYQSDISRSWVHGEASPRQRRVWNTVRQGQQIALETASLGRPVGEIDDAVRAYYEREGWGPGYRLPGLSHRTGHGIGLDGHEAPYLVHGDTTPLAPGMCFSDEPGLYIPGEFGIRLEDCWRMTDTGPQPFTPLARSVEDPI